MNIIKSIFKILNPTFGEKLFGFPITIDLSCTFFLFVGFMQSTQTGFYLSILFLSVLLHEFGHIYVAKKYGYVTKSVKMFIFGGVASIENMDDDMPADEEFSIAIAGPLVNVAIFAILMLYVIFFVPSREIFNMIMLGNKDFLFSLMYAQMMIVVFNVFIPVFPMDGGRILRSIVSRYFSKHKTNFIVSIVALVIGTIALIYFTLQVQVIAMFIFLILLTLNFFTLRSTYEILKRLKNVPSEIILMTKKFRDEEIFYGAFKINPEAPNSYFSLKDMLDIKHTFGFKTNFFDTANDVFKKFENINYQFSAKKEFEEIVPDYICCYLYKQKQNI